jgi:hypothetical protein
MFSENHVVQLAAIPLTGHNGFLWNRLHEEREEICEQLLALAGPEFEIDRELLQERLRIVDDSLDRLMS